MSVRKIYVKKFHSSQLAVYYLRALYSSIRLSPRNHFDSHRRVAEFCFNIFSAGSVVEVRAGKETRILGLGHKCPTLKD